MGRIVFLTSALVMLAALSTSHPAAAGPAGPTRTPTLRPDQSTCVADTAMWAQPRLLLRGERTEVVMNVKAVCYGERYPLHIVLVLDRSNSMKGGKIRGMKAAACELVRGLRLPDYPATRVGVVAFDSLAETRGRLTNREARLVSAITRIQARVGGGTAIDLGIQEGFRNLVRARREAPRYSQINEVMVLFSDGQNDAGCNPMLLAAGSIKRQGVLLITVCVGEDCDAACMRKAASSARYYFEVEEASRLLAVFERIRKEIQNIFVKRLVVKDTLPNNMRYIDGSAEPQPKTISANKDILEWDTNFVASTGVTYTFWVEPLEPGYWPTSVGAELNFWDNKGRTGAKTFEIPWVQVLEPQPILTPWSSGPLATSAPKSNSDQPRQAPAWP